MELKELMEGFAAKIGLDGLERGEEGAYALSGGTEMIQVFKPSRGGAEGCFFRVGGRGLEGLKGYI